MIFSFRNYRFILKLLVTYNERDGFTFKTIFGIALQVNKKI